MSRKHLSLYNFNQKETVKDVVINPELSAAQQSEIRELLDEYSEIFSDVLSDVSYSGVTHLIKHKPFRCAHDSQRLFIDKDIHTSTVAEALLEIFSRLGLPNKIHSDRGSQFTSTTTPYHVMSNGIVEKFNKTIKNLLKKVISKIAIRRILK